jgi:hypothetical protein
MADLELELTVPTTPVLSGEDFTVVITARNAGDAPVTAPPEGAEEDFAVVLTPADGGEPVSLSSGGLAQGLHPTDQFAPVGAPTGALAPGESRRYTLRPARYAIEPLPAGVYTVAVTLEGTEPGPVSPPRELVVEEARPVALNVMVPPGRSGSHVAFVHAGPDGTGRLYQGLAPEENPAVAAAAKVADVGPARMIAQARPDEGRVAGVAWVAWLDPAGRLGAALSYREFLAGAVEPVDLGLTEAQLQEVGWQEVETDARASFAVLGRKTDGVQLGLARLDADAGWGATVSLEPLDLPALPAAWRLTRWRDGGWALVTVVSGADGSRARLHVLPKEGGGVSEVRDLGGSTMPLAAMSVPYAVGVGDTIDFLFGPVLREGYRMELVRVPLDGTEASHRVVDVPQLDGRPPEDWTMLDGAPAVSVLAARLGGRLLGLTVGAESTGGILAEGLVDVEDLRVISAAGAAWAVWREGDRRIRSVRYPR